MAADAIDAHRNFKRRRISESPPPPPTKASRDRRRERGNRGQQPRLPAIRRTTLLTRAFKEAKKDRHRSASRSRSRERGQDRESTPKTNGRARAPPDTKRKRSRSRSRSPGRGPGRDRGRPARERSPPRGPRHVKREDDAERHIPRGPNGARNNPGPARSRAVVAEDMDLNNATQEQVDEAMQRAMGFSVFRTTKETKVPGNDRMYAARKEKKTEYRQYMNRKGGFNRPLSPSRK